MPPVLPIVEAVEEADVRVDESLFSPPPGLTRSGPPEADLASDLLLLPSSLLLVGGPVGGEVAVVADGGT